MNVWPVEHLCTKDVTTCIIDTQNPGTGKILATSIYWDGRIDDFPGEAIEAIKMARLNNYTLVLGGDLNARNILYGSDRTDKRGFKIEDILVEFDLTTCNLGSKPTCVASHPGSVIDVTITTSETEGKIRFVFPCQHAHQDPDCFSWNFEREFFVL